MYFDPSLLCFRKKGKFAKCWLAATNPSLFRKYCKKAEIDRICVDDLCSEIVKTLNCSSADPEKRFSLILASQLTFGVVSIYKQQVEILYERSSTLICVQRVVISELTSNGKRKLNDGVRGGKRARKSEEEDQLDVILTTESVTVEQFNLGPMPLDTGALSIRENNLPPMEAIFPKDGFGEMSAQEKSDFLDVLEGRKTMGELFEEELRPPVQGTRGGSKRKDVFKYPGTGKRVPPRLVADNQILTEVAEIEITRQDANNNQENTPNMNVNGQQEGETLASSVPEAEPVNSLNVEVLPEFSLDSRLQELFLSTVVIPAEEQPIEIQEVSIPDINLVHPEQNKAVDLNNNAATPENIDPPQQQLVNEPIEQQTQAPAPTTIAKKKPRNRKRKLKVDKKILLDAEQMRDQIDEFMDTLREYPDYVDLKKQKQTTLHWNQLNRVYIGKELQQLFLRNWKIRIITPTDESILDDILGTERVAVDLNNNENASAKQNENVAIDLNNNNSDSNRNEMVTEDIVTPPVMDKIQPLHENPDIEVISSENQCNKQLPDPETPSRANHNPTHSELNKEWGSRKVLQKLLPLWTKKIHPINMSVLCRKTTRLEAAFAFSTLLCLKKEENVALLQNDNSLAIQHIGKGAKYLDGLLLDSPGCA